MEFEWDDAKAASNLRKHGIPFEYAVAVFDDRLRLEREDLDGDYGETRWSVTGLIGRNEIVVIFTEKGLLTRIISARMATSSERTEYRENRELHI